MKLGYVLAILTVSYSAFAEEFGFVGEIDLDNDGVVDRIQSGPMSMFGNGGGPLIVTLSANGGSPEKNYLIGGSTKFAVERFGAERPIRLWSYWHLGSSEGVLTGFTFTKDEMTKQNLRIYLGATGSTISESITASIFKDENVFALERVSPYTVPPHPDGHEWGK